jgi:CrcB protein
MTAWILIGLGGALGSIARHATNVAVHQLAPALRFPLGTVAVNLVGCCVIGALAGLVASGRVPMRLPAREFLFVGVLGGFTTFSTCGLDTVTLVRSGDVGLAFCDVAAQVAGGLAGVYAALVAFERLAGR